MRKIWNLPDDGKPYEEIDDSEPTTPCPDPSQPYMWLFGKWVLVAVDSTVDQEINPSTEPLSALSPPGYPRTVFADVKLPDQFTIIDANGFHDGPYHGADFAKDPDTNVLYTAGDATHPIYLRILEQKVTPQGNQITVVDSEGKTHFYTLISNG